MFWLAIVSIVLGSWMTPAECRTMSLLQTSPNCATSSTSQKQEAQVKNQISWWLHNKERAEEEVKEAAEIQAMLQNLSQEELEIAARTDYEYVQNPTTWNTRKAAAKMARRYLESTEENVEHALKRMKDTIQFRRNLDVDGLIRTFQEKGSKYGEPLKGMLDSKKLYVQGYDRQGRSTYIFIPRHATHHDLDWTIREHVWTMERAIACSKAKDKTINAVIDFQGFSASHAPPASIGKQFLSVLRNHYAGHVNQIFLMDAPSTFLYLWKIFRPFVGIKTRDKIHFVKSKQERHDIVGKWYTEGQATSWMLPGGQKNRELNVDEYLFETPFNRAFDE